MSYLRVGNGEMTTKSSAETLFRKLSALSVDYQKSLVKLKKHKMFHHHSNQPKIPHGWATSYGKRAKQLPNLPQDSYTWDHLDNKSLSYSKTSADQLPMIDMEGHRDVPIFKNVHPFGDSLPLKKGSNKRIISQGWVVSYGKRRTKKASAERLTIAFKDKLQWAVWFCWLVIQYVSYF